MDNFDAEEEGEKIFMEALAKVRIENENAIKDKEWELLWGVRRSVRYHMRRCRFFDMFHSFSNFVGVFAGTGAAVTFLSGLNPHIAVLSSMIVAAMSSLDLVVGTGPKARLHNELAKQFVELEKDMVLAGPIVSEDALKALEARRLEIEAGEPPILRTLDRLCYNELAQAMGCRNSYIKIPFWQRWLANFISFGDPVKV